MPRLSAGYRRACCLTNLATDIRILHGFRHCTTCSIDTYAATQWPTGTVKLWSIDTLQPERTETGVPSLSHKAPDVMQQELQSMQAKDPDTCYTTVQFTNRNLLLAAGYVNT